jgi:hypothetical protein
LRHKSGRSDREQPAAASVSAGAAALRCLGPDDTEGTLPGPLPQEQAQASVLLGIEWSNPDPQSLAPIASITLTRMPECGFPGEISLWTRSLFDSFAKHIVSLADGSSSGTYKAVQPHLQLLECEASLAARPESTPERGLNQHSDIDVDEAPGDLNGPSDMCREPKREPAPASDVQRATTQLQRIARPMKTRFARLGIEDGSCTPGAGPKEVTSRSPHGATWLSETDTVDSPVVSPVVIPSDEAAERSDANSQSRCRDGEQVAFPSSLGPGFCSLLELGQARNEVSYSEIRGGTDSPFGGSGVEVVFPVAPGPSPAPADLATFEVDSENGLDSGFTFTEAPAASSRSAPYDSCESIPDHSWPFTLVRSVPSRMDLALQLESDCDDSESGARFWPFALLPPIPMDEHDADMHPDGDGCPPRPEWEFVWA